MPSQPGHNLVARKLPAHESAAGRLVLVEVLTNSSDVRACYLRSTMLDKLHR